MSEEYKQGDEFKTGVLSAGAKRFKLEGKRQGRDSFAAGMHGDEQTTEEGKSRRDFDQYQFLQMIQAEYDATVKQLEEDFERAEQAAAAAMAKARQRERIAQLELERIQESATVTADGRRVYMTENGNAAYYEDGNQVSKEEFGRIDWKKDGPSWEKYQSTYGDWETATQHREKIGDYQDRLQAGRAKLSSGQPLSPEELADLKGTLDDMPNAVKAEQDAMNRPKISAASEYRKDGGIEANADLNGTFKAASLGLEPEEIAAVNWTPDPDQAPAIINKMS